MCEEDFSRCLHVKWQCVVTLDEGLILREATCLKAAGDDYYRKCFITFASPWREIQLWICLIKTKPDMQILEHNCITKASWKSISSQGLEDKLFYNFRKADSVTIAVKDEQGLFFATKHDSKWLIFNERLRQRNAAFPDVAWVFDTLLSESKADSVDICSHINNKQYSINIKICVWCECMHAQ